MSSGLCHATHIRMDSKTKERIARLAEKFQLKKSDLIRYALYETLPKWEHQGVKLSPTE